MTKQQEKVLKHLLKKESFTNEVKVNAKEYDILGITEKEFVKALYYLEEGQYVRIIKISPHKNLSAGSVIAICERGADYFEKKKDNQRRHIFEQVQFWLPLIISIIALIIAA